MAEPTQRYLVRLTCGHEVVKDFTASDAGELSTSTLACPECGRPQPVGDHFAIEP